MNPKPQYRFAYGNSGSFFFQELLQLWEREMALHLFDVEHHRYRSFVHEGRYYFIEAKPEAERTTGGDVFRIHYKAESKPQEYETIPDPEGTRDGTIDRPKHLTDYPRPELGITFTCFPYFTGPHRNETINILVNPLFLPRLEQLAAMRSGMFSLIKLDPYVDTPAPAAVE